MSEEKNWKKIVLYLFDPSFIFELGKYIALVFGSFMIIERMIEFYINLPLDVKLNSIFSIAYMFALMSVPLALSYYMLEKFGMFEAFGDKDE